MKRIGFTLLELMIVIVIIGILATIAIPTFTKTVEKSRTAEAKVILGHILGMQSIYHAQYGTYAILGNLGGDVPGDTSGDHYFKYTIPIADVTSVNFNAIATRKISTDTGKDPDYSTAYEININASGVWGGTAGWF